MGLITQQYSIEFLNSYRYINIFNMFWLIVNVDNHPLSPPRTARCRFKPGKSSCPQISQINADESFGLNDCLAHPYGERRKVTHNILKICGNLRNLRMQSPFLGLKVCRSGPAIEGVEPCPDCRRKTFCVSSSASSSGASSCAGSCTTPRSNPRG